MLEEKKRTRGRKRSGDPPEAKKIVSILCDRDGLQNSLLNGPEVHKRVQASGLHDAACWDGGRPEPPEWQK